MADNIMNDNAKDNNADNNVIEFDSKVTEKDLLRFKFYHKYHTISGMAEIMLALIMIVLCVTLCLLWVNLEIKSINIYIYNNI